MNEIFFSGFYSMAEALMRIFFIILLAGYLVKKNIITKEQIDALSKITVIVLLPALVIGNTLKHFNPGELSYWWLIPIIGVFFSIAGLGIAYIVFLPDYKNKKDLLAVASMQNAGYLVLPIGQVVYPEKFHLFAILTFLFILGYNPVLWTWGKILVTQHKNLSNKLQLKDIITPPALANIISLLLVLLGLQHIFPETLVDSVDFLGKAAVPIATFVLGATLGSVSFRQMPNWWDTARVLLVKYGLIPLITIAALWHFDIAKNYPLLADFMIIQAAAAPATGLILQVRTYGGNRQRVASTMLIAYIFCLLMLPFWIGLWHSVV